MGQAVGYEAQEVLPALDGKHAWEMPYPGQQPHDCPDFWKLAEG